MELTLEEAAQRLGCSIEAARKRAARGTLASRHDGRRLLIILPDDTPEPPPADTPPDTRPDDDRSAAGGDRPADTSDRPRPDESAPLIEALQETIAVLRAQVHQQAEQLVAKDEQIRRAQEAEAEQRRIIAALAARLPELAAPVDVAAVDVTPAHDQAEVRSAPSAASERTQPVSPGEAAAPAPSERPRPWWAFWRWGEAGAG